MTRAVSHRYLKEIPHCSCMTASRTLTSLGQSSDQGSNFTIIDLKSVVVMLGDGPHLSPKVSLSPWQQPTVSEAENAPP